MTDAVVVAVANQKGGVGKSTCTICVARAAHRHHGARVLICDMDPQGNVTSALARERLAADEVTLADAITPDSDVALREVIVPTIWDGIDLAPGGATLSLADKKLTAAEFGREHRLREALQPVRPDYDLVIIDNPPSLLGQLLINSLTAAARVVLVTEADRWSGDGLVLLGKTIAGVRSYHNQQLEIVGTIVNKWRGTASNTRDAEDITTGMARHFPGVPVWMEHRIPLWTGIKDHIDDGIALDESKTTKLRVLADDVFAPIATHLLEAAA